MNVILCGYKCSGKTTLGKYYEQHYGATFVDTDALMLADFGKKQSIGQLHGDLGEIAFRSLEEKVISNLKKKDNTIIATGGGAVANANNVTHLKTLGKLLYLKVDKSILYERITALPLLPHFIDKNNITHSVNTYLKSRDAMYESVADEVFTINHETPAALAIKLHKYRSSDGQ